LETLTYFYKNTIFSFSPFLLNFNFIDKKLIKLIKIPYFLEKRYKQVITLKRQKYISSHRDDFKSTYDTILNTYK
jgi:hypothetical protein